MMFSEEDEAVAFLDRELPELLRRQVAGPGWQRGLRRRIRRERWARRAEVVAVSLQAVLVAAVALAFRPWAWNWSAGVPWGRALPMALLITAVLGGMCWSVRAFPSRGDTAGGAWRKSGN
jgi:hypothetical protein